MLHRRSRHMVERHPGGAHLRGEQRAEAPLQRPQQGGNDGVIILTWDAVIGMAPYCIEVGGQAMRPIQSGDDGAEQLLQLANLLCETAGNHGAQAGVELKQAPVESSGQGVRRWGDLSQALAYQVDFFGKDTNVVHWVDPLQVFQAIAFGRADRGDSDGMFSRGIDR